MGSRIRSHQQQARELGRLRTGWSVPSDKPNGRPRPVKSKTWVVSSHAEHYVEAAAKAWGGTVESWQPQGNGAAQYRVVTEQISIDAMLPPGDPLSQANEMWSAGGCQRRCDGLIEQISKRECICLARYGEEWHQQPKGTVCAPTSRLAVVLPDMPDIGVWRVETHSFYAANEMAGTIDMILSGTGGQGLVPVSLRIEPRTRVANGKTKHFPIIAVEVRGITPRQALSGPLSTALALDPTGETPLAIEAPRHDYLADAAAALTVDDVGDVYRAANTAKHLTNELVAALKVRADEIKAENQKEDEGGQDDDGVVEGEIVHDDEPSGPASWPAAAQPGSGARR